MRLFARMPRPSERERFWVNPAGAPAKFGGGACEHEGRSSRETSGRATHAPRRI
jgi:hypothetical protein